MKKLLLRLHGPDRAPFASYEAEISRLEADISFRHRCIRMTAAAAIVLFAAALSITLNAIL
jgi:hypothetical protein